MSLPSRLCSRPPPPLQPPISDCSPSLLLTPLLSPFSLTPPLRHSKQPLSAPLPCGLHYLPPSNPDIYYFSELISGQGSSHSQHVQCFARGSSLPSESEAIPVSQPHAPSCHMPSGTSTNNRLLSHSHVRIILKSHGIRAAILSFKHRVI